MPIICSSGGLKIMVLEFAWTSTGKYTCLYPRKHDPRGCFHDIWRPNSGPLVQQGHIYQWMMPSWEGTEDFLIEIPQIISVGSHDRDENGDRWKQLVYKTPVARGHLIESVDISDFTDNVSIAMRKGNLLFNLVYIFIFSLQWQLHLKWSNTRCHFLLVLAYSTKRFGLEYNGFN